ncbi:LemA family protein [Altibacter sp. HG106]|uniref:LemA family protein n=1 Tax=Altibacter sp. HG106 TaxID=3023937 RepID=UPI002350A6AE|nr:LemA family protein [Altibacter sp. HG106]MDC7994353.1 LemA family protein [Altibacter sp. HG106]
MKKWLPLIVILGLVLILGGYIASLNNSLVELDESAEAQWGNVESAYQRRADLIPNIVSTARGYAEFERETLTQVIEARSKATAVTIDPSNITPGQLQQFQEVQSGLSSALSRLLAVFERYPDLKANENFKELINELERTENRINVERNRYNETAQTYNTKVKKFPANFFAGILGFEERAYFKSEAGAEVAPEVEFDFSN